MRERETREQFWGGFAAGALIGTAASVSTMLVSNALSSRRDSRVVRLQESVQIGRPIEEVFRAWSDLGSLSDHIGFVESVEVSGNQSRWTASIDGKRFEWNAETTQFIPNEAIGWKSVSGPKHSGRISFSPIGEQTLVHVTMNYVPRFGLLSSFLQPAADHFESSIQRALREFKLSLEGGKLRLGHSQSAARAPWRDERTGTEGTASTAKTVDYTRPPEAPYPISGGQNREK